MSGFKTIILAVAGSMIFFAAQAWAGSTCHDVHFQATVSAVDPLLPFGRYAGTALVSFDGQPAVPAATSFIPAAIKMADDGSIQMTNALTFDLGQMGAFTVQDNAVLSPTENPYVYTMNTRLDNPVGTGGLAGIFGRISDHGEFSLATLTLTAHAKGKLCW
jgi:hypothetical protein